MKPHLRKIFRHWTCWSPDAFGVGETPFEAHANWYAKRVLKECTA